MVTSRMVCDSLSRQLSRHIGHTRKAISSRLKKIIACPSTSSIRCSGESSATTDQKWIGSNARLMRTICRRQWLVCCSGMPKRRTATPFFSSTFQHRPNTSQNIASFLLNDHSSSLMLSCMVNRIRPTARIIRHTGSARIRSIRKAIKTAGQAFSQFTVIFIDLNSSFRLCGNALIQSQSIGRLLFTQKIC